MAALEAEVAREAAAAAAELAGQAGALAQPPVGRVAEHGVLVAVGLAGDGPVQPRRRQCGRVLLQGLGEGPDGRREAGGARVVGPQQFGQVGAERRGAARFEDDDGRAGVEQRRRRVQGAAQRPAGAVEVAGGDVGQAAADRLRPGRRRRSPAASQHPDRGAADLRGEVLGEGVRPQHDGAGRSRVARRPGSVRRRPTSRARVASVRRAAVA